MPIYLLLPFVVFFACCVSQFWFVKQVRDRLIDCHADTFLEMERSSFSPNRGLWRLAWGTPCKKLGDPELNRRVQNLRILTVIAFGSWLIFAIAIISGGMR
jgi:hypothetical protein